MAIKDNSFGLGGRENNREEHRLTLIQKSKAHNAGPTLSLSRVLRVHVLCTSHTLLITLITDS